MAEKDKNLDSSKIINKILRDGENSIKKINEANNNFKIAIEQINEASKRNQETLDQVRKDMQKTIDNYRELFIKRHYFYTLEERALEIQNEFPLIVLLDETQIIIKEKKV